ALLLSGCATTYVPVSWGFGEKVQTLSRSDLTLSILFERYDPQRKTLRVAGASFDEVMMPGEVKYHLGAYRPDTKLIYRNLYHDYNDQDLRDLIVHELSHHIWFSFMTPKQREQWGEHLAYNPTPLRAMVRRVYPLHADYDTEDFAFTVEYARPVDIQELARLNIITAQEGDAILSKQKPAKEPVTLSAAGPELSKPGP
ncbi:MAG TPA: hypothetical protein VIK21_06470, partial [Desulfuromonadaceae bacterium]